MVRQKHPTCKLPDHNLPECQSPERKPPCLQGLRALKDAPHLASLKPSLPSPWALSPFADLHLALLLLLLALALP